MCVFIQISLNFIPKFPAKNKSLVVQGNILGMIGQQTNTLTDLTIVTVIQHFEKSFRNSNTPHKMNVGSHVKEYILGLCDSLAPFRNLTTNPWIAIPHKDVVYSYMYT